MVHTSTDPRLAAAVVDRITFPAHIIQASTVTGRLHNTDAEPPGRIPVKTLGGDQRGLGSTACQ